MHHEKFTERVRRVMFLGREEAARLHHDYIGTEHLLLGLVREENGVAVLRRAEDTSQVLLGLTDVLADDAARVDPKPVGANSAVRGPTRCGAWAARHA